MNPFLSESKFPEFDRLTPEAADEAFPILLERTEKAVAEVERAALPTWDGRVSALTRAMRPLMSAWHLASHALAVRNSDQWRSVVERYQPRVVALSLQIAQSRPLYDLLVAIREGAEWERLDEGRRRVVESALRDARDSGVALEGAARARFAAVETRLAELSRKFSDNVLDSTKAFALDLETESDAEGLPPSLRTLCASAWNEAHPDAPTPATPERGPWRVTLDYASCGPFLQYSARRDLRERVFRARAVRASSGEVDNGPLLREILALRRERATLVGFPDYAALALDSRMARTVASVREMIAGVGAVSVPKAREELADLRAFAARNGEAAPLEPWDVAYWSRRRLEALHGFSPEQLRPYFQFPRVLEGMFELVRSLFGVVVEPCDGLAPVWHPDVRMFRVSDAGSGAVMAHFYLDPYSRPSEKRGGAWMDSFRDRDDSDGTLPLALLCCNQAPPAGGKPSLMTLGEVETLFHEFGHALQCMLTRIPYPEAAGINNVEWDAVELASQFLENWCRRPDVLRSLSSHVDTGETLPDDLIAKIRGAATFCQGMAVSRQLSFAETDLDLHDSGPGGACGGDPDDVWRAAALRFSPMAPIPEDRFLHSFTHIFAGGYAAGYYSYMWADILACDAFGAFEELGADDESARRRAGRRFAETVLALGGARAPGDVFRDFRGRDPTPDAMLRIKGLA